MSAVIIPPEVQILQLRLAIEIHAAEQRLIRLALGLPYDAKIEQVLERIDGLRKIEGRVN